MDSFKVFVIDEGKIIFQKGVCFEILSSDDNEQVFEVKSTDTIYDLKLMYDEEEGIVPDHQSYFCGPVPIESDEIVLSTLSSLLEINGNTLDVKLRKAAMIDTDHDVTLVFGRGRRRFQKIVLNASGPKKLDLIKGKFGIVTQTRRDNNDNNTYTVERYKLLSDDEQTIVLKFEEGKTVAYLVTITGQEERLEPEMKEYRMGKTAIEHVKDVTKILANITRGISGLLDIIDWGKLKGQ